MAYTNIDDPSAHFQIALYTGNGTGQTITNDGNSDLKPDFLWFKNRSETVSNTLWDSTRGITKFLSSNSSAATFTNAAGYELTSFNTDGFGLGPHNNAGINQSSSYNYVSWQWKANGGTTVSNTDGDVRSVLVQANQDAGFSIVQFLGGTTPYTIGHGLGVAPDFIISKRINATVGWYIYHKDVGAGKYLTFGTGTPTTSSTVAFTSAPTSTVFTGGDYVGGATDYFINYCFAEKQGYSKFGKFVGNGNVNGPFVYLGFKPAFVMMKNTSIAGSWRIIDAKRNPGNLVNKQLSPGGNGAESTSPAYIASDFLSNGFKLRTSEAEGNGSGSTYIYMAFAENPFTTSTGIPATAR